MDKNVLLEVKDLTVAFDGRTVVKRVGYTLRRGRTLGIVGESGSGKSVSSLALMGLLPRNAAVTGSARLEGEEILTLDEEGFRNIRGNRIAMIFQEPMTSLNPVRKCGEQVTEMLLMHEKVSRKEARARALELFNEVMLPRPEKIFDSYPHEISGGQKQRVMIAMALMCNPDVLIADEPTTALDVTVQAAILRLLRQIQEKHNIGIIFITHDLGVIAQVADDIMVMYRGDIVETGPAAQVLHQPQHPYTKGLLACRPPLDSRPQHLPTVEEFMTHSSVSQADSSPNLGEQPGIPASAHSSPKLGEVAQRAGGVCENPVSHPLLQVKDLRVTYTLKKNILGKPLQTLNAVDHVSFDLYRGETLGLVGESGCGKSTLGQALLRLIDRSGGEVLYDGVSLDAMTSAQRKALRLKMQIIFQDPYSSLNPRITIGEAIAEPLKVHRTSITSATSATSIAGRVKELMQQVGLSPDWYGRYPHELSGGQRQRVCIARALIVEPELVVCDESVSALDVSVQAQVLNLLNDLKRQHGYTYLFITHDLSVVKFLSDRIMVMRQGRLVEMAPADELYAHPQEEYTRHLIDALPRL
ncbi:MAG: ABC transporter ATP-binding protein [Bacteroidales bacterium]|nr:ABC transporter ATP-binding protein [Bacteroidales bacterium]